ncbi:MAG: efflux RND transporter periplasmic adaptor subunit [Rhodothermales bacterium]
MTTPAKKNNTKRILIGLGGALVVLVVVLVILGGGGDEEGIAVETSLVEVRAVTQTVTASGKIRPELEVKISSDVSGEIVFLELEEGDRVEQGQLLVQIQPDFYAAQREQAQAGLLQAQADASRAEAEMVRAQDDLARKEMLAERGVIAQMELEAAQTQFKVAQASFEAAQYRARSSRASLSQASDQLRKTSIYAPIGGTVSQLNVEPGERVVGTSQMSGTEILRIAELDRMELEVDINENDIVNVAIGDSARIDVDAYPQEPFRGVVTQIANSARVSGAGTQEEVTNFPVKIQVRGSYDPLAVPVQTAQADDLQEAPPTARTLRPGMSGTVDIFTETVPNTVVVPIQAVTVRDFNKLHDDEEGDEEAESDDENAAPAAPLDEDLRRVVFLMQDGKAKMVEVETGISDDTHIAVTRGLTGGETVIVGPFRTLRTELEPDDAVRVEEEEGEGRGPSRS